MLHVSRFTFCAILYLLSSTLSSAPAQVVTYPLSGNLRAAEGSIEFWFRLEDEPDGTQARGCHYFPFFFVEFEGEKHPRISFSYHTIWSTNAFHFHLASNGIYNGELLGNPYIASLDETQTISKADRSDWRYPRTPRMKKGDWHYFAFTWSGGDPTTVALHIDGKPSILPHRTESWLWAYVEGAKLSLLGAPYHANYTVDDFRISSIARTEKEIAESFTRGGLPADRYTLLLDRFEAAIAGKETRPTIQFLPEANATPSFPLAANTEVVEGKTGKALKILP